MKDKIYRIIIELMVLSLCMFLVGCKNTEEQEKVKEPMLDIQENVIDDEIQDEVLIEGEEYSMKVTMEYVCSEFGIDEAEFEGIDFEDFVNEYNLTYESIQRENIKVLLRCYKEDYGKIKIPDYSYIYNYDKDIRLTKENQKNIAIVFFSNTLELSNDYYIFDFEIEKILVGSGFESHISENDIVGETNNVIKDKIIELFDKYDVYSWKVPKQRNDDIYGTEDGYTSWSLGIQFNDGTIWGLTGELINGDDAPENLDLFVEDLKALATTSSNE